MYVSQAGARAPRRGDITGCAYVVCVAAILASMCQILRLLAVSLLLAGCASSDFRPAGDVAAAPYRGTVRVLDRLPPEGTYQLVGIVTVRGVNLSSDARMFDQLKSRAAAQGADAVVPQSEIRERAGGDERVLAAHAIRTRAQ